MVRMGVKELVESQKMLCSFTLGENSSERGISTTSSLLMNDDKIELWSAKTEVYEVIKPA